MINLDFEHEKKISTQNIYDIINSALEVAEDDGMLNSFLFQRALYVFAAATVYEDLAEKIMTKIPQFPQLWDELVNENIIDKLKNDYANELNELCSIGQIWFDEYNEHIHSSYAVVNAVSNIAQNFTTNFQNQVDEFSKKENIPELLETAAQWGMNNGNVEQAVAQESTLKMIK